jgi:hypothetical protein
MTKVVMALVALTLILAQPAGAVKMGCGVSSPIYAADLNAGATWYFEVFNATPNADYRAKVTWPGDPSNGGHSNAGIVTDATGYGRTTLLRYWAPDGFLPGGWPNGFDPYDPLSGFVAVPGAFSIHVYGKNGYTTGLGTANCSGEVL